MTDDGRGQTLAITWYARIWRYLTSNPIVGVIVALLATVGVQGARLRYRDRRAARLQQAADLERIKAARERASTSEAAAVRRYPS